MSEKWWPFVVEETLLYEAESLLEDDDPLGKLFEQARMISKRELTDIHGGSTLFGAIVELAEQSLGRKLPR